MTPHPDVPPGGTEHPRWCVRSTEPTDVCDFHSGDIVELGASGGPLSGYVTLVPGQGAGDSFVELSTTDRNALAGPVDLTLDQAEELAARLIAAVARLRGVVDGPDALDELAGRTAAAGRAAHPAQCGATAWDDPHPFELDTQVPNAWGYVEWETCGQPADAPIHRVEGLDVPEVTS